MTQNNDIVTFQRDAEHAQIAHEHTEHPIGNDSNLDGMGQRSDRLLSRVC